MLKFFSSLGFAFKGILHLVRSERNFQIHLVAFSIVLFLGFVLGLKRMEWLAIILASSLVFLAEGLNTAFEKLCDHLHPEIHYNIRKIKDIAAGAVLIASLLTVVVGGLVFFPKIICFLQKTF